MNQDNQEKLSIWKTWLIKKLLNNDSSKEEILNLIANQDNNDDGFAESWLDAVVDRVTFSFITNGMYPTNLHSYEQLLEHRNKDKTDSSYIFGWKQLTNNGEKVFITGGEKDVMALASHNEQAICLNSETAFPSDEMINELKKRFKNVIVLYDIDSTGLDNSKKIAEHFQIKRMILPEVIKSENGKDIADFLKLEHSHDHHQ